jgi:PAS domain-containing protein
MTLFQGRSDGYAVISGQIEAQDTVLRMLGSKSMSHAHQPRPVRLACSITVGGRIRGPNDMMLAALGYSRHELENAPVGALLRPNDKDIREVEAEIFAKYDAVRRGDSPSESYSSWMLAKDGSRVDVHSTVTWNRAFNRWDVVAEVDQATLHHPQFPSPLERIPLLEWQVADQQQQLRELKAGIGANAKRMREIARAEIEEAMLENSIATAQLHEHADNNKDKGHHGGAARKYPDAEDVVRQAVSYVATAEHFMGFTVEEVCQALKPYPLSRNQLKVYFIRAGRMRKPEKGKRGDSLKETLKASAREAARLLELRDDLPSQLPST